MDRVKLAMQFQNKLRDRRREIDNTMNKTVQRQGDMEQKQDERRDQRNKIYSPTRDDHIEST